MQIPLSKQTIHHHCQKQTLLVPTQLDNFSDARLVMSDGHSSIYYKDLKQGLKGIEFLTNQLCLTFLISGQESFTNFNHQDFIIESNELFLIPPNTYLVSDFWHKDNSLKSFLFFFSSDLLAKFSSNLLHHGAPPHQTNSCLKIAAHSEVSAFMTALKTLYLDRKVNPIVTEYKLLELLYLLHQILPKSSLSPYLTPSAHVNAKRHIAAVMSENFLRNLSVTDYAALSGRSLSSFNRDFKRLYGMSPGQWVLEARLEHAHHLIQTTDMSITEISVAIGYDNISFFIKKFREKFDITPKQLSLLS